jgi:hypothetical protein
VNPSAIPPELPLARPLAAVLAPARPALLEGERLWPTCAGATAVVLLGDFLFWGYDPGLSLAIFGAFLMVLMLLKGGHAALPARVLIPAGLLLVSLTQMAVEISLTNSIVIAILFAVLIGELHFARLPAGWARWSETFVAWAGAPGRWWWLGTAISEAPGQSANAVRGLGERCKRWLRIALPAVLLLILFGGVFASGNRIFGDYLERFGQNFMKRLTSFDFSVSRVLLWVFLATLGLVFIRPREGAAAPREWARRLGEWQRADASLAFWQSALILAALNALFFAVNTIDVIYLWQRAAVPEGVLPKAYLHEGVNSLIVATVLAGIVLTFLFQQSASVTQSRTLKALAFTWVAQNLVLIAGVFLRLKLFVEMEEMTEKRVYVACFLLLVTAGFVCLCLHVWRGRAASQLIWRNAAATFVLFFVLQFLNVAGWICRWNLERWQRSGSVSVLGLAYDLTLGPSTWPVWVETVKNLPPGKPREELMVALREVANDENADRVATWREQQFRRDRGARALNSLTAPLGPLSEEEDELEIVRAYHRIRQEMRWTALDD